MDFCTDTEQCIQCVRGGGGRWEGQQVKGLKYNPFFWKIAYEHM